MNTLAHAGAIVLGAAAFFALLAIGLIYGAIVGDLDAARSRTFAASRGRTSSRPWRRSSAGPDVARVPDGRTND